jgi:hypothetical protein
MLLSKSSIAANLVLHLERQVEPDFLGRRDLEKVGRLTFDDQASALGLD